MPWLLSRPCRHATFWKQKLLTSNQFWTTVDGSEIRQTHQFGTVVEISPLVNQGFIHPIGAGMSEPSTVFSDVYRSWIYFKPHGSHEMKIRKWPCKMIGNLRIFERILNARTPKQNLKRVVSVEGIFPDFKALYKEKMIRCITNRSVDSSFYVSSDLCFFGFSFQPLFFSRPI